MARAIRANGARLSATTSPGGHDDDYWDAQWPRNARFYANALVRCSG